MFISLLLMCAKVNASPLTDMLLGLSLIGNGAYFEYQRNADENHADESRIAQNRAFYFLNQQQALGLRDQKWGRLNLGNAGKLFKQMQDGAFSDNGRDYLNAFLDYLRYRSGGNNQILDSGAYFNQASIELNAQAYYQAQELDYRNRQATDKFISLTSFAVGSFLIIKSVFEYHKGLSEYPKHAEASKFRWAFNGSQLRFGVRI